MDNIAALDQEAFERELEIKEAGWDYVGQRFDPRDFYGGAMLRITAVGEVYSRGDESLEIWWISPSNIGKVVKNGKEYPHPTPDVIRMLAK